MRCIAAAKRAESRRTNRFRPACLLTLKRKKPIGSMRSVHFFSRQSSMAAWREFGVANA